MAVFCNKCNRKIKNLEVNFDSPIYSAEAYEIICSFCANSYKVVKRPVKKKLTKRQNVEVAIFYISGLIALISLLIWFIYSIVIDIKEGKTDGGFPWRAFLFLTLYITWRLWSKRINRLEKQDKGKCCENSDCDLKDEVEEN